MITSIDTPRWVLFGIVIAFTAHFIPSFQRILIRSLSFRARGPVIGKRQEKILDARNRAVLGPSAAEPPPSEKARRKRERVLATRWRIPSDKANLRITKFGNAVAAANEAPFSFDYNVLGGMLLDYARTQGAADQVDQHRTRAIVLVTLAAITATLAPLLVGIALNERGLGPQVAAGAAALVVMTRLLYQSPIRSVEEMGLAFRSVFYLHRRGFARQFDDTITWDVATERQTWVEVAALVQGRSSRTSPASDSVSGSRPDQEAPKTRRSQHNRGSAPAHG